MEVFELPLVDDNVFMFPTPQDTPLPVGIVTTTKWLDAIDSEWIGTDTLASIITSPTAGSVVYSPG